MWVAGYQHAPVSNRTQSGFADCNDVDTNDLMRMRFRYRIEDYAVLNA
jgi:hypothetical protein